MEFGRKPGGAGIKDLGGVGENPSLAALSGGSAAFVALGEIGLKVFKARKDKIELRTGSPLAYLISAQNEFNK